MRRSIAKLLSLLCTVVFLILGFVFAIQGDKAMISLVALGYLVVISILGYFLRCPSCGRHPGRSVWLAEYCPYCGEPLEDE